MELGLGNTGFAYFLELGFFLIELHAFHRERLVLTSHLLGWRLSDRLLRRRLIDWLLWRRLIDRLLWWWLINRRLLRRLVSWRWLICRRLLWWWLIHRWLLSWWLNDILIIAQRIELSNQISHINSWRLNHILIVIPTIDLLLSNFWQLFFFNDSLLLSHSWKLPLSIIFRVIWISSWWLSSILYAFQDVSSFEYTIFSFLVPLIIIEIIKNRHKHYEVTAPIE